MLRKLKEECERRDAAQPAQWNNTDKSYFSDAYVSLDAVRNAWRNTTMHVERISTEEDAHDIFNAVRSFMRKLAARMDEQGLPKA
jgi:glycosidase